MTLNVAVLEDFKDRQIKLLEGGGEDKARARHDQGRMTARDRLAALFQEGTFQEIGMHIRSTRQAGVAKQKDLPADGVVVGTGYVGGRAVAAFSQDFTVAAGTLGKMHASKIVRAMQTAALTGMPIVAFNELWRCAHPRGGGCAVRLRPGVLPERAAVGCSTADRGDLRPLRRRRGLLSGVDGFRHHDEVKRPDVHHRPRGHQGGHRQDRDDGRGRQCRRCMLR